MGKRNSFLFTKVHDLKGAILKNGDEGVIMLLTAFMPKVLEQFAMDHPDFPAKDAILATSGLFSLDDSDTRVKYKQQMDSYHENGSEAFQAVLDSYLDILGTLDSEFDQNKPTGLLVCAFCAAMESRRDPETRDIACAFLDRVLEIEDKGVDLSEYARAFMGIALLVDFESWHDQNRGDPIVGPSHYDELYGKNRQSQPAVSADIPRRRPTSRANEAAPSSNVQSADAASAQQTATPQTSNKAETSKPAENKKEQTAFKKMTAWAEDHIIISVLIVFVLMIILFGNFGIFLGLAAGAGVGILLQRRKKQTTSTQNKTGGKNTMGLFKKKEDSYQVFLTFSGLVSLENDVLATMFNACKGHGFGLTAEPKFNGAQDQTWVQCHFSNNVRGLLTWFQSKNEAMVDFRRPVESQTTDEDVAAAIRDWFQTLNGQGIDFSFSASKEGKRKYNYEKWEAVYSPRRTFM